MNFNEQLTNLIKKTHLEAKLRASESVETLHFIYVSLQEPKSVIYQLFLKNELSPRLEARKIDKYLNINFSPTSENKEPVNSVTYDKIQKSFTTNQIINEQSFVTRLLNEDRQNIEKVLQVDLKTIGVDKMEKEQSNLEIFCTELVNEYKLGKMDPVIGREKEMRSVVEVLGKRFKNNPFLKGEPGVGKTAIVNGIAQLIATNKIVGDLADAKIYRLNNNLVTATDTYKGELAATIENIIGELKNEKNAILFIDDASALLKQSGTDISNILSNALEDGGVPVILTTTNEEYLKTIGSNNSLIRKFQPLEIEEPSIEESISILRGLKPNLEKHHDLKIKDEAVIEAVKTAKRYLTTRKLPDKAIDLLDQTCSFVKLNKNTKPLELDQIVRKLKRIDDEINIQKNEKDYDKVEKLELEKERLTQEERILFEKFTEENKKVQEIDNLNAEITNLETRANNLEGEGKLEQVSQIRYAQIPSLQIKLEQLKNEYNLQESNIIGAGDVFKIISRLTGIPVIKLEETDTTKYINIENDLKQRVMGQDEALKVISDSIIRSVAGIAADNRPIGSFLFVGPTGVGKTESAKALAEVLFNDEKKMIRLDMSEFQQEHMVQRLTGAPAGYVGYEDGGQLTNAVKENPYSVILLDEIEKAHPKVWDSFLQILDDGILTSATGETVDFTNTIIIMTSNIGGKHLLAGNSEENKEKVGDEIKKAFRPEFINRLDNIVYFNTLTQDSKQAIVHKFLERYDSKLLEKGYVLDFDESVIKQVLNESYDETYGARPIKKYIDDKIGTELGKYLLENPKEKNIKIVFDEEKGYLVNDHLRDNKKRGNR